MGNLFGTTKKSRVTELDRAVLALKKQRDELKRAQRRMEVRLIFWGIYKNSTFEKKLG